jgi:hypothetical protein
MRYSIMLILLLVLSGLPPHANAQTRVANKSSSAAVGKFRVWVPAGIMGDEYWIYLNGQIVSAPPRRTAHPAVWERIDVEVSSTPQGWEIYGPDGLILRTVHENWERSITTYMDSAGDPLHLFEGFVFALRPGEYTVEVAIYQPGRDFPFVITGKWARDIRQGQITRIFVALPDDWTGGAGPAYAAAAHRVGGNEVCSFDKPAPPDIDELQRLFKRYNADPMVNVLRGVDASLLSRLKGVVVLDLPPDQGGSREFDGRQIWHIANEIPDRYSLPSQNDVAECQAHFPLFSSSYALYGKVISDVESEIESFLNLSPMENANAKAKAKAALENARKRARYLKRDH